MNDELISGFYFRAIDWNRYYNYITSFSTI